MKKNNTAVFLAMMALGATLWATLPLPFLAQSQDDNRAEVLFQAAQHKAFVDGDLEGAIQQFKKILTDYASNRAVAAKALLAMGQCYEKLGNTEAQKASEQLLRDYTDQTNQATEARARLAALRELFTGSPAMTTRRVWTGADVDTSGEPSLDGRYLSFTDWSTGDLALRDLATGDKRLLTNKDPGQYAYKYAYISTISPDGHRVAYSWCCTDDGRFELRLVPMNGVPDGAKPRVLYSNEDVFYLQPRGWSPDGEHVLVTLWRDNGKSTQTALISVADGAVRVLKTQDWRDTGKMSFSPDGRYIVYDFPPKEDSPARDIFVLASDGSREIALVEHPGNDFVLGWAPDGKNILFASDRTGTTGAWAIGVADGRPQGEPQLVKPDVGNIFPSGFTGKGAFYYNLAVGMQDVYIATLDMATGKVVAPPMPASQRFMGGNSSAAWSPDGLYVAYLSRRFPSNSLSGPRVISIRSVKSGQERELPPSLSAFYTPIRLRWSPDRRFLLASGNDKKGRSGLYQIDVQTGEALPIVQEVSRFAQGIWSADGKAIFYVHADSTGERDFDIRRRDLETSLEQEVYGPASPTTYLSNLALSPDGRWLAFGFGGADYWEAEALLVIPAAGGDPRELLKVQRGEGAGSITAVEWTPDGTQLLFSRDSELWRIPAEGGQAQRLGLKTVPRGASVSVHPDGHRVAVTAGDHKSEVWVMENFWPAATASR